jgi:hypothetical protein
MRRTSIGYNLAILALGLAFSLSACQPQKSDPAAQTVLAYLKARTQSDATQMINLSCPDWEVGAKTEADSFRSMNAKLDGVTCQSTSGDENAAVVTCQGKIVTAYQGETKEWPLAAFKYNLVHQDGEWRMCGYK